MIERAVGLKAGEVLKVVEAHLRQLGLDSRRDFGRNLVVEIVFHESLPPTGGPLASEEAWSAPERACAWASWSRALEQLGGHAEDVSGAGSVVVPGRSSTKGAGGLHSKTRRPVERET
jgi:hypothetical protein